MIDVTFKLNGVDCSGLLATYKVVHEISYSAVATTMDGTEHPGRQFDRGKVIFSFLPLTDDQSANVYELLTGLVLVTYTDPDIDADVIENMRLEGSISHAFGLRSIDGNRYYKGDALSLRSITVR